MIGDIVLGVIGWGGSTLLVVSILQSNLRKLRILNLASCVLLVAYNSVLGVWPMAAMNAALLLINAFHLIKARRQARAESIAEPAAK